MVGVFLRFLYKKGVGTFMKMELVNKEVRRYTVSDLLTEENVSPITLLNEVLIDELYFIATNSNSNEIVAYDLSFNDIQRFFPVSETEKNEYLRLLKKQEGFIMKTLLNKKCTKGLALKTLKSGAGYYVGTTDEDSCPNCRVSAYFGTKDELLNSPLQLRSSCDNDYCNKGLGCLCRQPKPNSVVGVTVRLMMTLQGVETEYLGKTAYHPSGVTVGVPLNTICIPIVDSVP